MKTTVRRHSRETATQSGSIPSVHSTLPAEDGLLDSILSHRYRIDCETWFQTLLYEEKACVFVVASVGRDMGRNLPSSQEFFGDVFVNEPKISFMNEIFSGSGKLGSGSNSEPTSSPMSAPL